MTTLVLVTSGKNEKVDYVTIRTFDTPEEAQVFVDSFTPHHHKKYWYTAQIVGEGEEVELLRPE